jgi:uncharacterized protein YjbJ (UPF0337 family)
MGDRADEIKGKAKQSIGSLTGNEEMERDGQAEAAEAKIRRETEGAVDKGLGKAQEQWGEVTGDEESKARGKARQVEGDIKSAG